MNKKAIIFISTIIILLVLGFGGLIWTDVAEKAFWWNTWTIVSISSFILLISIVTWFIKSRKKW